MKEKVYVVTGATSFIASGLLRRLIRTSAKVYGLYRPDSQRLYRMPTDEKFVPIACDISDLKRVPEKIQEKCDVFYHLGWEGTNDKNGMYRQLKNVEYTLDAVNIAAELGCSVFIGAGSQAEYGLANKKLYEEMAAFPVTGYGTAKLCAGQMSRILSQQKGIRHIWTRIVSVYGPMDAPGTLVMMLIERLLKMEKIPLTGGEQVWDYLYIDDCAEALYRLAQAGKDGEIYNIGSGEEQTIRTYVEKIHKLIGAEGILEFGVLPYSPETPMFLSADISKLKRDISFVPETAFEEGIKQILKQLR